MVDGEELDESPVVPTGATVVLDDVGIVVVVVVVVVGVLIIVMVFEIESSSRRRYPGASAWTVHVPIDTAVIVPFDAMVHTDEVLLRYVTPWPAGSVAGVETARVSPLARSRVDEGYVQPVGVLTV